MDREHDVLLFVGVNTKPAHSELSDGSPQDILGLFGILILCSKYMIIRLRKPILRHLSTMWAFDPGHPRHNGRTSSVP
jgi:hypothetical protein